jgi:DNA-binding NarL/FixJ family response regulator
MPRTYSVLLAEPNPLLREKMAGLFTRNRSLWCVIQVDGRGNLARAAAQTQPDFILADLTILKDPEMLSFLRRTSADSRIIALVDAKLEPYMKAARELGLDGAFEKGHVGEEIRATISAIEEAGESTK